MESQHADLSALRIDRSAPGPASSGTRARRRLIVGAGVVGLVVAALLVALRIGPRAVAVELATATLASPAQASAALSASGYVVAQRKAAVASKGTGRLVYLGVVDGDRVRSGQVIARLEDSDIRALLAQAQATLQLYQADLHDAEQSLARERMLQDSNMTSQASYDAAEARHRRVVANIEVAKAMVQTAQVSLENMVIRAPFDGTVLTKHADVGEMVAPFAASAASKGAVVTMADMRSLQVEADVSESNIERITVSQPCEIVLDAYPEGRYPGYVFKIVPTADRAKATVQVKVAFVSYDGRVLPEMSAKVYFLERPIDAAAAESRPVLTVPSVAVVSRNGQTVVYVVREDRAVEMPVTVGDTLGASVVIRSGLAPGDRLINRVTDAVRPGVKVRTR